MQPTEKQLAARWQPGQSGNGNGRPVGARGRFTERFMADVSDAWHKHGAGIIDQMATAEPMRFAELASRLIPKDVQVSLQARLPGNLDPDDWSAMLEVLTAVKTRLPGDDRKPGEIAALVTEALRSHSAKLIEGTG